MKRLCADDSGWTPVKVGHRQANYIKNLSRYPLERFFIAHPINRYGYFGHKGVQHMKISVSIKEQACERLLHFHPKKTIARELGISASVVRDWSFFVNKDR